MKINSIGIDCNIVQGSYLNSNHIQLIHQFFPYVPYGYKRVESFLNEMYYPVSIKTMQNKTVENRNGKSQSSLLGIFPEKFERVPRTSSSWPEHDEPK